MIVYIALALEYTYRVQTWTHTHRVIDIHDVVAGSLVLQKLLSAYLFHRGAVIYVLKADKFVSVHDTIW